jgi:hypothetical protein
VLARLAAGIVPGLVALLVLIDGHAVGQAGMSRGVRHVVRCDEIAGTAPAFPPTRPDERLVLGRVSLPAEEFPYPPGYQPGTSGRLPYFAKYPLFVRAGSEPVELFVPSGWRTRFAVGWGNHGSYEAAIVKVNACPRSALGPWLGYPGGYYLRRPACVPLIVRVGAKRTRVRIGIGKQCPAPRAFSQFPLRVSCTPS